MRLAAAASLWMLALTVGAVAEPLTVEEVASGVFVHRGVHEDFTPANRGGIANLGFIVGSEAVAVIDSGGSKAEGLDLLAAIRARSDLPVRFVVLTHDHPDHVLGNAAFEGGGTQFVGHANLRAAMAESGPAYLANMAELLGQAADGSTLVPPTVTVRPGEARRLELGGRTLIVQAWGTAHTDSDVTAIDTATGTLFAGDLLFMQRLPVVDGSINGWLAVMDELAALPADRVVPGHGPVSAPWPQALSVQRSYLAELRDAVRQALRDRRTLSQAVEEVAPPPAGTWLLTDGNHERNVTAAYTELEWE